jgi:large subunit ribosomal protein L26e
MKFSVKVSEQRRKQRKLCLSAPSHVKYTLMSAPLSEELQKEHGIQSLPVRRDDTVEILRGSNKGTSGKVNVVYRKKWCLYIEKIQKQSKKGGVIKIPI